jgi:membrane-bound lytic murein transglycosylase D
MLAFGLALTAFGSLQAAPDKRHTNTKRPAAHATTQARTPTQARTHTAPQQLPDTTLSDAMTQIRDSAIVMPESFNTGLDSLLSGWLSQHFIHTDENCISNDDVPPVPDSVYIERLKALPTIIDMPYNQVVRSYIDMYVHRRRTLVEYMVGLSQFYFPLFEDALSRYHMPTELRCLPVIESALKPSATSRAGAAGLWQFMPSTGRKMGLEVNSVLDERRDPVKSTDAACRYLMELYNIYNDWTLAIAAYNCGPGNVNKAIKRSGGKMNFWDIYFYLPQETRGYIPAFIAANYIMTYHCEHNLCGVQTELPPVSDTVMVDHMVHFKQIATMLDVPLEQIRALNPQYAYDLVPGNYRPSALRLPAQKLYEYIEREESISAYKADSLLPKNGKARSVPADKRWRVPPITWCATATLSIRLPASMAPRLPPSRSSTT